MFMDNLKTIVTFSPSLTKANLICLKLYVFFSSPNDLIAFARNTLQFSILSVPYIGWLYFANLFDHDLVLKNCGLIMHSEDIGIKFEIPNLHGYFIGKSLKQKIFLKTAIQNLYKT